MKKRFLSLALALTMCLGLMAVPASAANLPDWYFLFAIFKNVDADAKDADGKAVHVKYTMTQKEVEIARENAREFEEAMNSFGVMRAHVDVVEIDTPVTEMRDSNAPDRESGTRGSLLDSTQAAPLLEGRVDLNRYDHVTCIVSLNDLYTAYMGITGSAFENGTGHSCANFQNEKYALDHFAPGDGRWPPSLYIHEYLHFMERMSLKWGFGFGLHLIGDKFYAQNNENYTWKTCYTDIILNRVKGDAETGTGVNPTVWQYPPHVFRTMTDWNIPYGVTSIGEYAFDGCNNLKSVTIPASVTSIGKVAFRDCSSLQNVTIPASVTGIENWTFGNCAALTWVSIPAGVTSIGYAAFYNTDLKDVYYGGTEAQWKAIEIGEYNEKLTRATIHYNSTGPTTQPTTPAATSAAANPTNDSLTADGAAQNPTVYKIGGSNYFKIRDLAAILNGTEKQFSVGYDAALNSVTATTGQGYAKQPGDLAGAASGGGKTAQPSNDTIYVNGQKVDAEVYKIDGSNYFKLRDLGKALNFYVGWTAERGMYIETDKPYTE